MGKRKKRVKKVSASGKPLVSICTPTYNRRQFIPFLIKCFKAQTYPKELMEWIVIDDGEDSVEDLFKDIEGVKYFRYEEKIKLGRKSSTSEGRIFNKDDKLVATLLHSAQPIDLI